MYRAAVALILVAACGPGPDQVAFDSGAGAGADFGACDCQYYDASQGDDPSIQITCRGGEFFAMSFSLDSRVMTDQDVGIIFTLDHRDGAWAAGARGSFSTLGPERRDGQKIVRSLGGVDVTWPAQTACDAARGCQVDDYAIAAGAAHGGSGGCQDFWATVDQ